MEQLIKQMMEQMNNGFDSINKKLDTIEVRLEKLEYRLDRVEYRLDGVEASVESLRGTVENNAVEFRSHFRHIEEKLDHHDRMFEFVSESLSGKWK